MYRVRPNRRVPPSLFRWSARSLGHTPEEQKFHESFLCMQPVLSLVPDDALWSVDDVGRDFLAPVCRQTVHEERIGACCTHHFGVDLPVFECPLALCILVLESNAGPG